MTVTPTPAVPDPDLTADPAFAARSGARWQLFAQVADGAGGLLVTLVLARLVTPSEFGVVGLFAAVATLAVTMTSGSLANAVVVLGKDDPVSTRTAWWLCVAPSLLLGVVMALATLALGRGSAATTTGLLIGLSMPISAILLVQTALHQRRLRLREVSVARLFGAALSTVIPIAIALAGAGLLGLIARQLLGPLGPAAYLSFRSGRMRLFARVVDRNLVEAFLAYAKGFSGFTALNQFSRQGDNILVGAFLGASPLGYYTMAYRVLTVPISQAAQLGQSLTFPLLARIAGDPERSRAIYLRSQKLLLWLVAPVGLCSIAEGDAAVGAVLGPRWYAAGKLVQIFGAVALVQAVNVPTNVLFQVHARTDLLFRWGLIASPIIFVGFVVGLPWGVEGVAWAYLVTNVALVYPYWRWALPLGGLTGRDVLSGIAPQFFVGLILLCGAVVARKALGAQSRAELAGVVVALTLTYWIAALGFDARLRGDLRDLVVGRRQRG